MPDSISGTNLLSIARLLVSPLRLDATPATARAALAQAGDVDWAVVLRHADAHTLAPLLYDAWRQAGVESTHCNRHNPGHGSQRRQLHGRNRLQGHTVTTPKAFRLTWLGTSLIEMTAR